MTTRLNDLAARAARHFRVPNGAPPSPGPWLITNSTGEIALAITKIVVSPADDDTCSTGLLAYLQLELGSLIQLDGVTVRYTEAGRLALSFPSKSSRSGKQHSVVRPRDQAARAAIERTILDALGIREEAQR
ncbi:MAG: hypothetical protein JNM84_20070 [Planctomycetes bacterium]|jgi:DNA-binding cell septation regulator SpoVG|nr:hypothetical protein [Planctomycetota bacterium]